MASLVEAAEVAMSHDTAIASRIWLDDVREAPAGYVAAK
jgi:hypothetical protein